MVNYHSNESIRELVSYIEKYHPMVLFVVRPEDTIENRRKGCRSGQPDILILENRCRYTGLALWAKPKLTKTEIWFRRRLERVSYKTIVSDDWDDLRLEFMMYIAMCLRPDRVDSRQLELVGSIRSSGPRPGRKPLTTRDCEILRYLTDYVRDEYPSAVLIPGLGADDKPDLTIISPDVLHNGLAIWIFHSGGRYHRGGCYIRLNGLSNKQLYCVGKMAGRSYLTIADDHVSGLIYTIDNYMMRDYERNNYLPGFQGEGSP